MWICYPRKEGKPYQVIVSLIQHIKNFHDPSSVNRIIYLIFLSRCNSVSGLEDRLSNIEGKLSSLTALLQTVGSQRPCIDVATDGESPISILVGDQLHDDSPSLPPTDRHIVRGQGDSIDRYHGPCTLFALCNEFRNAVLSEQQRHSSPSTEDEAQQSRGEDKPTKSDALNDVLTRMCLDAGNEESFNLQSESRPIRLPPKQFLLIVQTYFFQWVGYETDVFVQSYFWSNAERIYSRPLTPADEVWVVCFNTIILLVLGSFGSTQGNDSLVGSQFALHFLLTVRTALNDPRVLMAPKLINVQTLALLVSTPSCDRIEFYSDAIITNFC
jgi:hypothetical protein